MGARDTDGVDIDPAKRAHGRRAGVVFRALASGVLALLLNAGSAHGAGHDAVFQLEPPDAVFLLEAANTWSPRDTLFNLIDNVAEVARIARAARRAYDDMPGLRKSATVLAAEKRAQTLLQRAGESLDVRELPPAIRRHLRLEATLQLKEVLSRVELPARQNVPGAAQVDAQQITRWRIPGTSVDIVKVAEGERAGEFLFSARTVARVAAMYRAVRHLPYASRDGAGIFELYVSNPGALLPPKWLAWVADLPDWTRTRWYGQALWKWVALVLIVLVLVFVPRLVSRLQRRLPESESAMLRVLQRLVVPGVALLLIWVAEGVLANEINFTGDALSLILKGLLIPKCLIGAYIAVLLPDLVAEKAVSYPGIDTTSLDANMIRMVSRVVGVLLGLSVLAFGLSRMGVPLVPLVASLGVGGLAVALAARPTLENFIGGIILFTDRPVRVGDFCSFGDKIGTVESIGVRSTNIRGLDRTVITVPNATFADIEIVNWARCDRMLIRQIIGLRYETTFEQLRYVLARLREMFVAHPSIDSNTVRIRFVGYGSSSLDIEIRVYALTNNWNEFFAIQEDGLLRAGEIIEQAGSAVAFPSQTLYMSRDGGLNEERGKTAAREVDAWRKSGQLPFPGMSLKHRERIADTLDYPPTGSPGAEHPQESEGEAAEQLSIESEGNGAQSDVRNR